MSPGGRNTRWVTLADGPMAGDRLTSAAFSGPARSIVIGKPVEGQSGLLDFHEYQLSDDDWASARWVRFVRRGPVPPGPITPRMMLSR